MRLDVIADKLAGGGARRPEGRQLALLAEVVSIYEQDGLVPDGKPPALWRCCPERDACWERAARDHRPGVSDRDPDSEKGCIFAPWIGPHYRPGGVCVLGENLRYDGGDWDFAIEHRIATGRWGQEQMLRAGKRKVHRSRFAWCSLTDAAALSRSAASKASLTAADGDELAATLLSTARLEAVKCSQYDHRRSQRTNAMRERCPPRYLARELHVIKPAAILTYGDDAWSAIHLAGRVAEDHEYHSGFLRTTLHCGQRIEVFAMPHPAARGNRWGVAREALLESLTLRPVRLGRA